METRKTEPGFYMTENINKETSQFPCSSCGAATLFDPESGAMKCDYCGTITEIDNLDDEILEHSFMDAAEHEPKEKWQGETKMVQCENCGGQTILEDSAVADKCQFCGSPHVVSMSEFRGIKPESLIPFKISRKKVQELFKKWISRKPFAPRALKKEYKGGLINGIYVPYWTYDTDTFSAYTAEAGTYYYVTEHYTVMVNGKPQRQTRQVRKIRWRWVSGTYPRFFDDILVNASNRENADMISRIEPFRTEGLVNYQPGFLSGFAAERYAIDLKQGWQLAKDKATDILRMEITRQINADEVRNLRLKTNYSGVRYRHTLFPVWISSYRYRNKTFRYTVNGQTGRFHGKAPVSVLKVILAVVITLLVIAAAVYLLGESGLLESGSTYYG